MADQKKAGQNIDQIRELIFGEYIQKYERRFKDIAQDSKKLNQLVEELRQQLAAEAEIQKAEQQKKIGDLKKSIQSELQKAVKQIESLQSDKVDSLQLANLLIDLGMRLKGENVLDSINPDGEDRSDG